jgi:hypothetical protein
MTCRINHRGLEFKTVEDYYSIGDFLISKDHSGGFIPNHYVKINEEITIMDCKEIAKLLQRNNLSHPYFDYYIVPVHDYQISDVCMESYPCKHWVTLPDGTRNMMSGLAIYRMLLQENKEIPDHFEQYANFGNDMLNVLEDYQR